MYPFIRVTKSMIKARFQSPLSLEEAHETHHICWPWDMDMWGEMNNGIALSLYDIGRLSYGQRMGLVPALRKNRWGLAVAGSCIRYRRRVRAFQKFTMRSQIIGRDERFIYLQQTMWRNGDATSSVLYRTAVTDKNGIVPTQLVADALGHPEWNPDLPEYAQNWIEAEGTRPWPPEI